MITKEELAVPVLLEMLLGDPLTELQQRWLDEYNSPSPIVHIAGHRDSGRTSFVLALYAILAVLNGGKTFMVITSPDQPGQVESHKKICSHYIEKLITWIAFKSDTELSDQFECRYKGTLGLRNGSYLHFRKQSPNSVRGLSMSSLFLDLQAPTVESIDDEFMACILPCLAVGSRLFVSLER